MSKDIYIDFDGTICPNKNTTEPLPPPTKECLDVLHTIKSNGYNIVIYSVRSNPTATFKPNGHKEMIEYLTLYNVPYDIVCCNKNHFQLLIDDKGLGVPLNNQNVDWTAVKEKLKGTLL
jgi:hypothetical protein